MILTVLITLVSDSTVFAQFDWLKKKVGSVAENPVESIKQTTLSQTEIGQGLKEALKVGINNSVSSVSKAGGFFDNQDIKIPLPEKLNFLDTALRKLG